MRQRGAAHLAAVAAAVRGGSNVPAVGRPDWPNKQGRPMMIMKDM